MVTFVGIKFTPVELNETMALPKTVDLSKTIEGIKSDVSCRIPIVLGRS